MRRGTAIVALISVATLFTSGHHSFGLIRDETDRALESGLRAGEICREGCQEVDRYLTRLFPQDGPGVAVLVMKDDQPILLRGFGKARIADPQSGIKSADITPDTVFDLGSLSKQFTAMAILMLIERSTRKGPLTGKYGRLRLGDKLSRFFPKLPRASDITIHHLLTHRSGLPEYLSLKEPKWDPYYCDELESTGTWYARMVKESPPYLTNRDVIKLVSTQNQTEFNPGEKFSYSNTGYVVLAEVLRKLTSKRLAQFLQEEIFKRLQMTRTFVFDDKTPSFKQHSLCYRRTTYGRPVSYKSIEGDTEFNYIHGDGNVHTTIADMVKWELACNQIHNGTPGALIRLDTFLKAFDPLRLPAALKRGPDHCKALYGSSAIKNEKYGSGFLLYSCQNAETGAGAFALYHGGDWLGFHSYLMRGQVTFQPGKRISMSIVVLSNYHAGYVANTQCKSNDRDPAERCTVATELSKIYWDLKGKPEELNVFKCLCLDCFK